MYPADSTGGLRQLTGFLGVANSIMLQASTHVKICCNIMIPNTQRTRMRFRHGSKRLPDYENDPLDFVKVTLRKPAGPMHI
jgi:hypothetical protein